MSNIHKTSFVITVFTILGMLLNFFCTFIMAAIFGASKEMDIFWAATTIPIFISGIFASALNFTFIPVFSECSIKNPGESDKIASSFLNLSLLVTTGLCLLGILIANPILKVTIPGFTNAQIIFSTTLLQILFPIIIFTTINELMASLYYAKNKFIIPSCYKIISPLFTILFIYLFHGFWGTKSIVYGMLSAAVIQTILLITGLLKAQNFKYIFTFEFSHPGVVKILKLIAPLILAMFIYRTTPLLDRYFLSFLSDGSISHVSYAAQLLTAFSTVIVGGIAVSTFPTMSNYAATGRWENLKGMISKALRMVFFLSVPVIFLLGLHVQPLIQLFWERGAFTETDTLAVSMAFAIYCFSLPGIVMGVIIGQGFYVLQDSITPSIIGILETILYFYLCGLLISKLNYLAIPVAYIIYFYVSLVFCALILRYKLGNNGGRGLLLSMQKSLLAVILPFIALEWFLKSSPNPFISLLTILLSFVSYLLISRFVFKMDEVKNLYHILPLKKS